MKKHTSMFLASTFVFSIMFSQETITSTFDNDNEGWAVSGGIMYFQGDNGHPGGFIEFEDDQDGAGVFIVPGKFLGDLLSYNLGSLEFDLINTVDNGQDMLYGYGTVSISSPVITASKYIVPLEYIEEWTSFILPLEAEEWGLSATAWDSLLSDVTEISIQMDAQWNYYDRSGLDNFAIVPYENGIGSDLSISSNTRKILIGNHPNPFSVSTTISWNLEHFSMVNLSVYDFTGREVDVLVEESQSPGYHEFIFDAGDLPDGIYFYRIRVDNNSETSRMILHR